MFRNTITQTPLTTDEANSYFSNISGAHYRNDVTFLTSLRAMLGSKLKEDECINLSFQNSSYTAVQLSNLTVDQAFYHSNIYYWADLNNQLTVHIFRNSSAESNTAWLEFVNGHFATKYTGWHKVEKVTAFFRKAFQVYCFINPERKSTALFVEDIDMRRLHFLQCGISAFLPWYFDVEQGFSDDEMELIQSLREKTSDRYEAIIDKIADKYDFHTLRIKRMLAGFETNYEREQCEQHRRQIRDIISQINSMNDRISNYLREKSDVEIRLLGLETKIAQGGEESEIMDYFLRNKCLVLKDVSGCEMSFVVKSTIDFFDEDMAKDIINRNNSYFYNYDRDGTISHDDMKLLMTAIFVDQILHIRTCAAYRFSMRGSADPMERYNYGIDGKDRMANPHIDHFGCIGNYRMYINERLTEGDYIGALEQCIASGKSLNFADHTVMCEFVKRIQGKSSTIGRCIVLPDGKLASPTDAVAWLHEQKRKHDGEGE